MDIILTIVFHMLVFLEICLFGRFIMQFADRDARFGATRFFVACTEPTLLPLRWIFREGRILDFIIALLMLTILESFLVRAGAHPIIYLPHSFYA